MLTDRLAIAFEAHGTGSPAVVLVHGASCDRTCWRHQLAASSPVGRDLRLVAVDLAGHGQSGPAPWSIEAAGADVAAVVTRLGLERVVLVGHGLGGAVNVEAARHLPGRVVGLVWIDTREHLGVPPVAEACQALAALGLKVVAINPHDGQDDGPALVAHGVEVLVLPGAGALPMLEAPAAFDGVLRAAIDAVLSTPRG